LVKCTIKTIIQEDEKNKKKIVSDRKPH